MIRSGELIAFHDGLAPAPAGPLAGPIETNHRHNQALWKEEDLARRRNVSDAEIAANKRAIDGHNQKRNDAVEQIDEVLLQSLASIKAKSDARLSSETAGAMTDRLSILSLKIRAMREQTQRTDVERAHIDACAAKLARLVEQRADLGACLDRLLAEAARGDAYFKVYRQFKMYNDVTLNPALYRETGGRKA
jgi:hypothetical protein